MANEVTRTCCFCETAEPSSSGDTVQMRPLYVGRPPVPAHGGCLADHVIDEMKDRELEDRLIDREYEHGGFDG